MVGKREIQRQLKALAAPVLLDAVVTSAPMVGGNSAGYVIATVAGQAGVRVEVSPDQQPPVTPGDMIRAQPYGSASATSYQMAGRVSGARADSGRWTFSQQTIVNGETYEAGDQLLGSSLSGMPNWYYKFSEGRWYSRVGTDVFGYDDASGDRCWGPPTGMNFFYDASAAAMLIRNGSDEVARIDGPTLSLLGFQRLGFVHGPAMEWGYVDDVDTNGEPVIVGGVQQRRYYLKVLGEQGLPIISILSGTDDNPNDAAMILSRPGASSKFIWKDGQLDITGTINADSGTIGTWEILTNRLESTNGRVALVGEADDDFGEGLSLTYGAPDVAGAVKWFKEAGGEDAVGIDFTYLDDSGTVQKVVKQSQVSAAPVDGATSEHRWIAYHQGGSLRQMTYNSDGILELGESDFIKCGTYQGTGSASNPNARYTEARQTIWVPGTAIAPYTNMGGVARATDYSNFSSGPVAQLLSNGSEVVIPLPIPYKALGCNVYVDTIELHWYKAVVGAYFPSIWIAYWAALGKTAVKTLTNVGLGLATGWWNHELLTVTLQAVDAPYNLILSPAGMVSAGDLRVAGVRISYVTL